jgi:hypothetical protein
MSDTQQGPDWWQAADHRWYPPELHPAYQAQQTADPQSATATQSAASQSAASQSSAPQSAASQSSAPQSSFQPPAGPDADDALEARTFIRSLYDFSFSSFITLKVIRVLYILITVLYTLGAVIALLVALVGAIVDHSVIGFVTLVITIILVPIAYFIYLTVARVVMEILMVLFNIGKDVRSIRERGDASLGRGPAGGTPGLY